MKKNHLQLVKNRITPQASSSSFHQMELFDTTKKIHLIALENFNSSSFNKLLIKIKPGLILDTREYPNFFSIYENMSSAKESFTKNAIAYNVLPIHKGSQKQDVWHFIHGFKNIIDSFFDMNFNSSIVLVFATKHMQEFFLSHYTSLITQNISNISMKDVNNATI